MPLGGPTRHLSQLIVLVSITGTGSSLKIRYSYTDPYTQQYSADSPTCNVKAFSPFHIVYALDYMSTLGGWRFRRRVEPRTSSPSIRYQRAANRLSMTTMYRTIDTNYSFYLLFKNMFTGHICYDDPQEGNVPPPQSSASPASPIPTPSPKQKADVPAPRKKKG